MRTFLRKTASVFASDLGLGVLARQNVLKELYSQARREVALSLWSQVTTCVSPGIFPRPLSTRATHAGHRQLAQITRVCVPFLALTSLGGSVSRQSVNKYLRARPDSKLRRDAQVTGN